MRVTHTHDEDAGTVTIVLEFPSTADPARAADIAWASVDRVLTALNPTTPEGA